MSEHRPGLDPIALLREMVELYSPSGEEGDIGAYLVARMRENGFHAYLDEAGNAIGEMGAGPRTVILLGHMDTVSGFIPPRIEEGRLYGRGAVDAKGPLAAFIAAAARHGPPRHARLVVIGAVEEEARSTGARAVIPRFQPDFVVIGEPSGWEHITLGYKGSLSLYYRAEKPHGHTAGQEQTPAEMAVQFWNRLTAWAAEFNREKARAFDQCSPTLLAIHTDSDGFTDTAEVHINIRWPLGMDLESFQAWARQAAEPAAVCIPYFEEPFRSEKNSPLVGAFLRAIRAAGGEPRFKLKTGTSDMNVVGPAWGCPIVAYGPGDSRLDHTPDEHIELEEYRRAIQVLENLLEML